MAKEIHDFKKDGEIGNRSFYETTQRQHLQPVTYVPDMVKLTKG